LTVQTYDPKQLKPLVDSVLTLHKNKEVLIVGHSNTVPGLVSAFGALPVPESLTEADYDYLYRVVIDRQGKATSTSVQFGASHRGPRY
jgi:2,3-bisphosphoglycerate-dependent phosphoglycerate mutase